MECSPSQVIAFAAHIRPCKEPLNPCLTHPSFSSLSLKFLPTTAASPQFPILSITSAPYMHPLLSFDHGVAFGRRPSSRSGASERVRRLSFDSSLNSCKPALSCLPATARWAGTKVVPALEWVHRRGCLFQLTHDSVVSLSRHAQVDGQGMSRTLTHPRSDDKAG